MPKRAAGFSPSALAGLRSLKVKFVLALVLLVSLVIGGSTLWMMLAHRHHMRLATEEKGRALTDAIERGMDAAMRDGRHQDVQRILERVGRDPDIEQVLLLNSQGKIARSTRPELVGQAMDRDRLSRHLDASGMTILEYYEDGSPVRSVVKKIANRPECHHCHGSEAKINGVLHVDLSFARTREQIAEMERTALWTMLLTAAVLAAGGGFLMVRMVERPVGSLIRTMARVEAGDLAVRADPGGRDEIGRLAESFNAMVDRLEAARTEIEAYHRDRLDRAERLAGMGTLAASLAHEIKNPLAGIDGAVQVLADELPDADSRKEIMREILGQVRRLDKTVRDLLAYARPGCPDVAPCDLHQVLDRTLLLLAGDPEAKQVRVARSYGADLPLLTADGRQLGQVFLNLILNAIQAMPDGGQVRIRTECRRTEGKSAARSFPGSAEVLVEVADTGPGIPAHLREEIFKPFVTTKHRGTGLGLSVSRRIVEEHGGRIAVECPPGGGTIFRVVLPVGEREA